MLTRLPPELRNQIFRSGLSARDLRSLSLCSSDLRMDIEHLGPCGPWQTVWNDRFKDGWADTIWCQDFDAETNYREVYDICALMQRSEQQIDELRSQADYWIYHKEPVPLIKKIAQFCLFFTATVGEWGKSGVSKMVAYGTGQW
jgi:hypothetical protein